MSLHHAAMEGKIIEIQTLLAKGIVNVNELQDGWSPLHLAGHFGKVEAVQVLLQNGADVHIKSDNELHNTPLHAAASNKNNREQMMELLLSHGAYINEKQRGGWTVLHLAAQYNDTEMILYYLKQGADPFIAREDGKTALELAEDEGCLDAAAVLRNFTMNKF
jgi:uncharacterized protein